MSSRTPAELTLEQLALRERRKVKKIKALGEQSVSSRPLFRQRPWIPVTQKTDKDALHVKILTFNLLAQCLVRRELFPASHCLKASQRQPMIHQEVLSQSSDIMCLQEVDRLEKLTPVLERSHYSHVYAAGFKKNHGCMIAFKQAKFAKLSHHVVDYDQEEIRPDGDCHARQGRTFRTRNIGLIVALKSIDDDKPGVVVGTTHLFWHPMYHYERARQAGILVREILKFRSSLQIEHWPCVIAGDFNCSPDDPTYALLVGDPLSPEQRSKISDSHVVHTSVEPAVQKFDQATIDNEEGEATDLRVITSARAANPADGLLSITELEALYANGQLRSIYDIGLRESNHSGPHFKTFGDRVLLSPGRHRSYEPEFTSYTHYWKSVLDYIFVLGSTEYRSQVLGLLAPHNSKDMEPGLPKDGICGSDHISLAAQLCWQHAPP